MSIRGFRIGIGATDTIGDIVSAYSYIASNGQYETLESPVGTDYQVTAGKTLYITRLVYFVSSSDAITIQEFGYADDAVAEGAAAPSTNKVALIDGGIRGGGNATGPTTLDVFFEVPAGKYLYWRSNDNGVAIMMNGLEL